MDRWFRGPLGITPGIDVNRLQRRLNAHKVHQGAFDAAQPLLEVAVRERSARKVRAHLRRMEAVVLVTPRWSRPQGFLEGIAMDLAVSRPALSCRTASLRHLKGRTVTEAWRSALGLISQLAGTNASALQLAVPGSRQGFRHTVTALMTRVNELATGPSALLCHGAEYLPLEALEDLSLGWLDFAEAHPDRADRRVTLMLAGCVDVPIFDLGGAPRVTLTDYGEAEAAAALVGQTGPAVRMLLEGAARFTGGVPAMVDALGEGARRLGAIPRSQSGLIRALGPIADEIRGAVDIVAADSHVAERLDQLSGGEPREEEPSLDAPLLTAGLVRRVRTPGVPSVMLRAPAIGQLLG